MYSNNTCWSYTSSGEPERILVYACAAMLASKLTMLHRRQFQDLRLLPITSLLTGLDRICLTENLVHSLERNAFCLRKNEIHRDLTRLD